MEEQRVTVAVEDHTVQGKTLNSRYSEFNLIVISWICGIVPSHELLFFFLQVYNNKLQINLKILLLNAKLTLWVLLALETKWYHFFNVNICLIHHW